MYDALFMRIREGTGKLREDTFGFQDIHPLVEGLQLIQAQFQSSAID